MNFTDIVSPLLRHAAAQPDHPAFVFNGGITTHAALVGEGRRIATALGGAGIGKGDRGEPAGDLLALSRHRHDRRRDRAGERGFRPP